ncbi:hypothetical protein [Pseudoduganella aquatica]|uniref:Uncharacterized protein n=1 Tax=Pseudoduganella aquatica TaxID=2660641 RepID=A0A7X4HFF8_9BURK|nr:hypothetical protein [Pseudoduganella aquatica]MYN10200.1 hypothetical protein [Pseudoduganella aquatica]
MNDQMAVQALLSEQPCWWLAPDIAVELNAGARQGGPGTLLVGLGDPEGDGQAVCLNYKGDPGGARSVAALVAGADAARWQAWRARLPSTGAIRTIVVEDFSLDTCCALLLFGAALDGRPLPDTAAWVAYVSAWEGGDCLDGADLSRSAACLLSVLGHSYLPPQAADVARDGYARAGLHACLALMRRMLASQPRPEAGIGYLEGAEYGRALAHLAHERQMYELALRQASRCQLLVDLAGSGRQVLLDALILSEVFPSGVLKVMARADSANSWTRKGYALLALHRPGEAGNGNDMVLSLDPRCGATLEGLWRALEALEAERWAGGRPADAPRALASYRDPANPSRMAPGAPNQPWYDDNGRHTLLAAPKLLDDGTPGSRLDWRADVLPALWRQYFLRPAAALVEALPAQDGAAAAAVTAPPGRAKAVRVLGWNAESAAAQGLHPDLALLETPSFQAWLASHSQAGGPAASPLALPPQDSYEVLRCGAVQVLAHRHGVTLFEGPGARGAAQPLAGVAAAVAAVSAAYSGFLADYADKLAEWTAELGKHHGAAAGRDAEGWGKQMHEVKARALAVIAGGSMLRDDFDENRVSEALQRWWGVSQQRGELLGLIDRIDGMMRHAIAARTEMRQRVYGSVFSALGLGLAANHIWEPIREWLTMNSYEWQLKLFKESPAPDVHELAAIAHQVANYELATVGVVVGFSLLGFILYWRFGIRGESH